MKIRRLSIRNIASVERGDIDFENGLNDSEKGGPASLFLITGDTGSGKSVILDCIAMSLYGTTPRVKGVNGVKNNSYLTGEGEEVSVNDISQYTRLGISHKDPCYAELSFIGNDGEEYLSRFSLGYTNRHTYRAPQWSLTIGKSEVISGNRKEEIRLRILQAVGLTFEQFGRMAMLAQGQFASFLTGKKEERERILEQLTATDRFSRYGEAIANIYKRAKERKKEAENRFAAFRGLLLGDEEREKEERALQEGRVEVASLTERAKKLEGRIAQRENVERQDRAIAGAMRELAEISAIEGSDSYKEGVSLLSLWDSTAAERKAFADLRIAREEERKGIAGMRRGAALLALFSADLQRRNEAADRREEALDLEKKWVDGRESLRSLFERSASVADMFRRREKLQKGKAEKTGSLADLRKSLADGEKEQQERLPVLKKEKDDGAKLQERIDTLTTEREALAPASLNERQKKGRERKENLTLAADRLARRSKEKGEIAEAVSDLDKRMALIEKEREEIAKEGEALQNKERAAKEAAERYTTMHLSVESNFRELRRRLVEEKAEACPLCGHKLDGEGLFPAEEDFTRILSPLEEERDRLAAEAAEARRLDDERRSRLNIAEGERKAGEKELKRMRRQFDATCGEVASLLAKVGVADGEEVEKELPAILAGVEKELEEVKRSLDKAEELQKEINGLTSEKRRVDKRVSEMEMVANGLSERLAGVRGEITTLEKSIKETDEEEKSLSEDLTTLLGSYAPGWREEGAALPRRLARDVKEYTSRSEALRKGERELEGERDLLASLGKSGEEIAKLTSGYEPAEGEESVESDVAALPLASLGEEWVQLRVEVASVSEQLRKQREVIGQCEGILKEYYESTGRDEASMAALVASEPRLKELRATCDEMKLRRNRCETTLENSRKSRLESLVALGVEDEGALPPMDSLLGEKGEVSEHLQALLGRCGEMEGRLKADASNRERAASSAAELEKAQARYEKWDQLNDWFGGTRFRTLVQSHILRPLLRSANIYLRQITDHYTLTCSDKNEQLSILVLDRYNGNAPRSVTVLSGGERFMISLALSLALSAMNKPGMNVDILFIDEGFGTLDASSLDSVMETLRRLPEIAGQNGRRVGVISHREELAERIGTQIRLRRCGEGRSRVEIQSGN